MKKVVFIIVAVFAFILTGMGQIQNPSFSSNPNLAFSQYISGVKYAEIGLNPLNQEQVDKQVGIAGFYYLAQKYLLEMGFEYVALTSAEKAELDIEIKSYCEYTLVMFGGDIDKNSISNSTISFVSCNGDMFSFTSNKKFTYGKFSDVEKKLVEDWQSIIKSKGTYKVNNQLQLPSNPSDWTKDKIQQYLSKNKDKLAAVEGVYERVRLSFEDITAGKYTVGVIKNPEEEGYIMIYLSGAKNSLDWETGEYKAILNATATKDFYAVDWISRDKSLYQDVYCSLDQLGFNVYATGIVPITYKFIKILPRKE